jgi:acetolactate synthase-1/2/3 large subunit
MHFGYDAAPLLRDADLVLALECDVPWSTAQEAPPENAFLVQIGADAAFQRYPMRTFRADLAITATAESVLEAVHNAAAVIAGRCGDALEARRTWLAAQAAERRARLEAAAQPACDHITPAHLTRAISQIAGPEAIVFNEYPLLLDHLERSKPGTFFGLSPAGGLGWGLGAAIGAKLAAPDKFVIAAVGDGAYMFANPTACHWMQQAANAPVLTVVVNNSRYGAVRRATLSMFRDGVAGRDDGMGLADLGPSPPFHAFVAAQGGFGEIVERPQQLAGAMARAKRAVVEEGRQALLNVVCPC